MCNPESQEQSCKCCFKRDGFDFHVSDEIWEKVLPDHLRNRVVCLYCFDKHAKEKGVDYAPEIKELYFAGHSCFVFKRI